MTVTIENIRNFNERIIQTDEECKNFLNNFLLLLDQVINYKEISELGLEIFTKNKDNQPLKKHLLDTVFSGQDFNVLHYAFCRKLYKNQIMITTQDIYLKLEKILSDIHKNELMAPIGRDFECIILATPLIFFYNEINLEYKSDCRKYCKEISHIFEESPKVKRIPPKWTAPLNIRNEVYDLMDGENTFQPDDLNKVIKMAGDPKNIPHVVIY